MMRWPDLVENTVVKTSILEDDPTAKSATELWVRGRQDKAECGTWRWWTDISRLNDGKVGAAAVC
jgi:hypothetical protein